MHSNGKGISRRSLPYRSSAPTWCKQNVSKVTEQICKLAKKGHTPSQIGVILRDFHGVPQVKSITGSKILRILKVQGLAAEIPEDLYCLIKKAVSVRKHLERFRQDKVKPLCFARHVFFYFVCHFFVCHLFYRLLIAIRTFLLEKSCSRVALFSPCSSSISSRPLFAHACSRRISPRLAAHCMLYRTPSSA